MTTRELFQSKKELRNWWARIVDDPQFAEVLLHARSEFIETVPGVEQLAGARFYEVIITRLAEADPSDVELPTPGLLHHVEEMPAMPSAPPPPPKPQPKQVRKKK